LGQRLVQFVIGIALARLLLPEQFGLIGMLAIFMAVAQTFTDSGYGGALIQKQETTETELSSVFYFNLAIGILATAILYLAAPWIASFYNRPELTSMTRVLSLIIFINALSLVHFSLIHKQLAFKALTKISLIEGMLSGLIGVTMAVSDFGVWSLVAQQVSASFFRTILLWVMNPWRPAWVFSPKSLNRLFGYGSRMLATGVWVAWVLVRPSRSRQQGHRTSTRHTCLRGRASQPAVRCPTRAQCGLGRSRSRASRSWQE
jgi:O-antigen/teichoic acid export membrane protein